MTSKTDEAARASFTTMEASTQDDWKIIVSHLAPYAKALPDRVLAQPKNSIYKPALE